MRMKSPVQDTNEEKGKLRRWVSNLQLESWQLELLITGFSIFLLASSLEEYDNFRRALQFDKLSPGSHSSNPIFVLSGVFLLNTIPWLLRFFLINLLIHLLLRGFWIGIVGLSSVSSVIDFDGLNLKGKFRKFIPQKVRSLDELIVYLDKVSSVIFAYTYLLVFSILSVMLVFVIVILLFGTIIWFSSLAQANPIFGIANIIMAFFIFLFVGCAILFFLDTLFFSTFKKSKWFNPIFFPIYRVFSVLSLSFLYRSIYYHLITNYKKKEIITVSVVLIGLFVAWSSFTNWDIHRFLPASDGTSDRFVHNYYYEDTRGDRYISKVSIPSRFIRNDNLELFIHYDPKYNDIMRYQCAEFESMSQDISLADGFRAGYESQKDSTKSIEDFFLNGDEYGEKLSESLDCLTGIFEVLIDGELVDTVDFSFMIHPGKGERGFYAVIDLAGMERGKHRLEVRNLTFTGIMFMQEISDDKLSMRTLAQLPFWTH